MIDSCLQMLYEPEMAVRMEAVTRLQAEGKAAIAPLFDILMAGDMQGVPAKWTTREECAAAMERAQQAAAEALLAMGEPFFQELTRRLLKNSTRERQAELKRLCKRVGEPLATPLIQLLNWDTGDTRSIHSCLKRSYGALFTQNAVEDARRNVLNALSAIESRRVAAYLRNCSDDYALANKRDWRENGIIAAELGFFALLGVKGILTPTNSSSAKFVGFVWTSLCVLIIVGVWLRGRERKDEIAPMLGTLSNSYLAGIAASYLNSKDKRLREAAKWDLTCLLPHLREEHQGLFTPDEINTLLAELNSANIRESAEFIVIALNALRYIGDASALPPLRRIIAHQNEIPSEVTAAAQGCLTRIEQRLAEVEQVDTLLRPSSTSALAPDTLLRAAQGTDWKASNMEERRQLLRPR